MAATDSQSLLTQAQPYIGYGLSIFQGLKVALLVQIALAHNASANVTPAGLITAGQCFACFSNTDVGKIMELQLLVIIAT
jgi:hypothetical protein